ncbi:fructose-bisphosphate aldolase class II [Breznakia sp. PF5-3]|uniref:ketose-bisphosphate aldolase n=1 Tax=unclassified Breznakia TaxID=2623764 RepID=UPI0024069610|nr:MULTISPECIES: ketose-bisphosphate aldolase [unclassified Breznakia]MDL2276014.1 ketose-bisphosphate aldolase [Breznakia sp. OttesenSCG-928-G09]MDF9824343.1 fructose-bisphosphate aldolase class II [Breznakia sp. PM6-1]MDF9835066.1 fructose-bisphosphate aldolase class II [Breznakia sp. PF5-3]MDF9837763.1 fructose-bisphosphate aldolase class II [Breznakia sp. PFB2-8]MDF9859642.1 fructose-bisphosphate aldolase class II [Breznakia sp. PH5-24]
MLMNMKDLLEVANKNGFAVPAFNIGSDQLLKAVMQESIAKNAPVILELSPDELKFVEESLIESMIYEAKKASIPVVIHLDHGDNIDIVKRAIQAGFTSVMIDASKMPYDANVEITKQVVALAHPKNVSVEAELGTIGVTGNSIEGGTKDVIYTDPEQAVDFVEKTGVDTLAVAIGTAHGIYPKDMKPELRLDILQKIKDKVEIPLVLHGGSSNKDEEIAEAVKIGISKINISSDIKVAFYEKCREVLNANPGYREPLEIYPESIKACRCVVGNKIDLFNATDKASLYR